MSAATDQETVHATAALRERGERVAPAYERRERLLETPLIFFRSQCQGLRLEPVDCAAIAAEVLRTCTQHELGVATSPRAEGADCCKQCGPGANTTPAESAQQEANALQYAQCMLAHGVANFPDPSPGPEGEFGFDPNGLDIDPSSPTFQAAHTACYGIAHGSK
jgi:hypothetical protein